MQNKVVPLVIMGASTGGTRVLPYLFARIPRIAANILVVQHMPGFINATFVKTMAEHSRMAVRMVEENDSLQLGTVFLAPGDRHCTLSHNQRLHLSDGPKVNFVRPSVDVTLLSVREPRGGGQIVGVILTGMGHDGAAGLEHLKNIGGTTIAQDQASCAVFGMPKRAIETGCVDYILSPDEIAQWLATAFGEAANARLPRNPGKPLRTDMQHPDSNVCSRERFASGQF
jgi:two-component system chemotaxis response regulator CheB